MLQYNQIKYNSKYERGLNKMLENLRNELIGKEMSFMELDSHMTNEGFYSVFDDGVTENIKQDKNVIYTFNHEDLNQVQIFFNITIDNTEEEVEEAFYLEVTQIEEF